MSTEADRDRVSVPLAPNSSVELIGSRLVVRGPNGEVARAFPAGALTVSVAGANALLTLTIPANRKRAQALLHTWAAHVRNLSVGVTVGFEAKMKVVAAHFPMKVSAKDDHLLIENFLGEKHPRTAPLVAGVAAAVDGDFVVLSGRDIEQVGQSAANIERATRIRDYDPRVFQDGIYLIEHAHPKGSS